MADAAFELRSALTYATHDGVELQGDFYLPKTRGSWSLFCAGWERT